MQHRHPTFSVIIPTYNRCALVTRAADSALGNAPTTTVEVIIVDDASTDHTIKTLHEKYDRDIRVWLLHSQTNEGPSSARNRGLNEATGDFIIFLDSDDVLLPSALAYAQIAFTQVRHMQFLALEGSMTSIDGSLSKKGIVQSDNPGWHGEGFHADAFAKRTIAPPAEIESPPAVLKFGDWFPAILFGDLFFLSGLVIRRQAALAAGPFNVRYRYMEDWGFCARLCLTGPGGYLGFIGFHREIGRADQLCRLGTPCRNAAMHHRVLDALKATDRVGRTASNRQWQRARGMANYQLGRSLLERNHVHLARAYLFRALRDAYKPFKCLVWIAGGTSIMALSRDRFSH